MGKIIEADFSKRGKDLYAMTHDLREQRTDGLSENQRIRIMLDKFWGMERFKKEPAKRGVVCLMQ